MHCSDGVLPGWSWSGVVAFLSVLLLASLPYAAEAGKCIEPSRGSTAFCEINYQVYVSADTLANDTAYWFALDRAAESLTEEWDKNMGCSARYASLVSLGSMRALPFLASTQT